MSDYNDCTENGQSRIVPDCEECERTPEEYIDIVFDGPPSHESGRFIEVNNPAGASISVGEWIEREDGRWMLRVPDYRAEVERLRMDHSAMWPVVSEAEDCV